MLLRIFVFFLDRGIGHMARDRKSVTQLLRNDGSLQYRIRCHSWREFVLSCPLLWTDFCMSFQDPSERALELVKLAIERNLERSQNLPLSCHVWFTGTFDKGYSRAIAALIVAHQKRCRNIELLVRC